MQKSGRVALAEMVSRGKEKLVLIRPSKGGLILQTMFYANEIRDFNEIPKSEASRLTPAEFELANGLVEKLSSENFEPEAYEDEYQNRVRAMLDSKVKRPGNHCSGKKLYISEGTVKTHLHKIYDKLHVDSRLALALYAREKGLV
jgi:non-homologous end joining protein Ku